MYGICSLFQGERGIPYAVLFLPRAVNSTIHCAQSMERHSTWRPSASEILCQCICHVFNARFPSFLLETCLLLICQDARFAVMSACKKLALSKPISWLFWAAVDGNSHQLRGVRVMLQHMPGNFSFVRGPKSDIHTFLHTNKLSNESKKIFRTTAIRNQHRAFAAFLCFLINTKHQRWLI